MEALIFFGFITLVFVAIDAVAMVFGVDSRPGFDDSRAPVRGIYV